MFKRLLAIAAVLTVLLLAVMAWNAARVAPMPVAATTLPALAIDAEASATRLAGAIAFATVSRDDAPGADAAALAGLAAYLQAHFPRVYGKLDHETLPGGSLLLRWPGRDAAAKPLLLAAHLDVVPADAEGWTHPPFAGVVAGGFVWGRGALDDKSAVLALHEAVDALLASGFAPASDVYFAFGHDEEVGGTTGAAAIAATLKARGVRLGCVLDEGSFVFDGVLAVARRPVALIGIAEKGEFSVELEAHGAGGHAALPAPDNPVAAIARALAKVDAAPFPTRATTATRALIDALAPETSGATRLLMANRWLAERLLVRSFAGGRLTSAMVRTTAAPTVLAAGEKDNVIPRRAVARMNVRLLDGDDSAGVLRTLREAIDDPNVDLRALPPVHEPSPVSRTDGAAWQSVAGAAAAVFADAAIVPGQVIATTDARHYVAIADQLYRFLPVRMRPEDVSRVHGRDERIAVAAHADAIRFYAAVIAGWTGAND